MLLIALVTAGLVSTAHLGDAPAIITPVSALPAVYARPAPAHSTPVKQAKPVAPNAARLPSGPPLPRTPQGACYGVGVNPVYSANDDERASGTVEGTVGQTWCRPH